MIHALQVKDICPRHSITIRKAFCRADTICSFEQFIVIGVRRASVHSEADQKYCDTNTGIKNNISDVSKTDCIRDDFF